jgi:hypothetical protein
MNQPLTILNLVMLSYLLFISFYQDQKLTDAFPCYLGKKQSLADM